MLSSGHFYSSPAFLGWAGVVVAVATLAVIVAQLSAGTAKRVLTYSLMSDTALLSQGAREKAGSSLQVALGDHILEDPHVVSILIGYKGRRDIRGTDFEGSVPLLMEVGTPILNLLGPEPGTAALPAIAAAPGTQAVAIGPGLIRRGQLISIDLLTNSQVNLRCVSPLADVTIREAHADSESSLAWLKRAQSAAFTLFGVGLFGWFVSYQTPFYFVLTVFLLGALGLAISVARAAITTRRHRGQLRQPDPPQPDDAACSGSPEPVPSADMTTKMTTTYP